VKRALLSCSLHVLQAYYEGKYLALCTFCRPTCMMKESCYEGYESCYASSTNYGYTASYWSNQTTGYPIVIWVMEDCGWNITVFMKIRSLTSVWLNSFNVWVIYRMKTLEHSMGLFFLILERRDLRSFERILKIQCPHGNSVSRIKARAEYCKILKRWNIYCNSYWRGKNKLGS